jgi:hypothetical protein
MTSLDQPTIPNVAPPGHLGDWNFLVGKWRVRHRKLAERLVGSTDWMEFDGECECWMTMGEGVNVDDHFINQPTGAYRASTIRVFDPKRACWDIYWIDGRAPPTVMADPMMGGFEGRTGRLFADGRWEDKPLRTRFLWFNEDPQHARWEQAFSLDRGKSWETNWEMRLERVA